MKKDYLILIVAGLLLLVGGLYWGISLKLRSPNNFISNEEIFYEGLNYERLGLCSKDRCLFRGPDGNIEGFEKIRGYYKSYIDVFEESDLVPKDITGSYNCDGLIITTQNSPFLNDFIKKIDQRDRNKFMTSEGNLLLPVNLSADYRELILNSSQYSPIELGIVIGTVPAREANPCESSIKVIFARQP
jgi:hypothetical protein